MNDEWRWYCSNNQEFYHGEFATRLEAIAVGFSYFSEGTLFICEGKHSEPTTDVFDFDRVLEDYAEKNEESWGEDGEPLSDIKFKDKRNLEEDLAATLRRYLGKNDALRSWNFSGMRNQEEIRMDEAVFFSTMQLEDVLVSSFRYALGRKTYVVPGVALALVEHWGRLKDLTKELICGEIDAMIATGTGMAQDNREWQVVLDHHRGKKDV